MDRLTESFGRKLLLAEKMLHQKEIQSEKQNKALEEELSLLPKIDLIINRTKELHKHVGVFFL